MTISLQYVAPTPEATVASSGNITDAWHTGWDVFVGILFAIGLVLAVAAPFLASAVLVLGAVCPSDAVAGRADRRPSGAGHREQVVTERDEEFAAPNPEA